MIKTCATSKGVFCPSLAIFEGRPIQQCSRYKQDLTSLKAGALKGWTARCCECLKAEKKAGK